MNGVRESDGVCEAEKGNLLVTSVRNLNLILINVEGLYQKQPHFLVESYLESM